MTPRWILRSDANSRELYERQQQSRLIDEWWQAFQDHREDLERTFAGGKRLDVPTFMHEHLNAISSELMWEFGASKSQSGHQLAITPEINRHLYPLAYEIIHRAPPLTGWEFFVGRQRDDAARALVMVRSRAGVDVENARVKVTSEMDLVSLQYEFPKSVPRAKLSEAAFVLSESLFGETTLDRYIGEIGAAHVRSSWFGKQRWSGVPLLDAPKALDAAIQSLRQSRPSKPWGDIRPLTDDNFTWSMISMESGDRKPSKRPDLIAGQLVDVPLFSATMRPRFFSDRFSRFGELFIYLQSDAAHVPREERVRHRQRLEEAADNALAAIRLGAVIGGEAGTKWDYIEMAVTKLPSAAEVLCDALRTARVPRPAWIRCHDATLAAEWRGVWDDVEPPPAIPADG